jgi:hypothetical protein
MDELQQQVIAQLPEDGSAISFDEWKQRVLTHVGMAGVARTANKFNRGHVAYAFAQDASGATVLMVSRVGQAG